MRRIAVVGNAGSGKTVLSLELGRRLHLPVVHLDRLFWNPGWIPTPTPEWRRVHAEIVAGDEWVIDGNYGSSIGERLMRADSVVFFDRPAPLCLVSVCRRSIRSFGSTRPDLSPGCPEHLPDWDFIDFIWRYGRVFRPRVLKELAAFSAREGRVFHLKSRRQARRFLDTLPSG